MPRRPHYETRGAAYHLLNRYVGRLELFEKPVDYLAFEKFSQKSATKEGQGLQSSGSRQ